MADDEPKTQDPKPGDEAPEGTPGTGEDICRECAGTGRKGGEACPACDGTGIVQEAIGGA